jgi:DNA-binding transcriptional regulator YiaG
LKKGEKLKKPDELDSNIGGLIKKIRTNVGISQMKFAEEIDVSNQQCINTGLKSAWKAVR